MQDHFRISLLLDFYGPLLTNRQFEVLDLYFNQDLSLGEAADQLGITRQGVHAYVRKARSILEGYEDKLGLVERYEKGKAVMGIALSRLDEARVEDAKALLKELLAEDGGF
ncbi:MAG TPA: DNA-binding protein [Clostridiales bacterium]|nr:DNA-binding protein [Clostridiales bacterium]